MSVSVTPHVDAVRAWLAGDRRQRLRWPIAEPAVDAATGALDRYLILMRSCASGVWASCPPGPRIIDTRTGRELPPLPTRRST